MCTKTNNIVQEVKCRGAQRSDRHRESLPGQLHFAIVFARV